MNQLQEFFTQSLEGKAIGVGEIGQLISAIRGDDLQLKEFFQSVKGAAQKRDNAHDNYQDNMVARLGADMTQGLDWLNESKAWDQVVCACRQGLADAGIDYTATLTGAELKEKTHEATVSVWQSI